MEKPKAILCSKGFRTFFNALVHTEKPMQIASQIAEQYPQIADELPIGKIEMQLDAPESILDPLPPNGRCFEVVLSSDNAVGDTSVTFRHTSGDHGIATLVFYPPIGYQWNEEEKESLEFLSQVIFTACGKARLGCMISQTFILDLMTGAANSRGFTEFGEMLYQKGILDQYVTMYVNIKNFNYINRTVGSKEGDSILKKYVRSISKFLEPQTEMISRLGGDNFTILLKSENTEKILNLLSSIRIESMAAGMKQVFDVRSRVGIYQIQKDDTIADALQAVNIAFQQTRVSSGQGDVVWFKESMLNNAMRSKEISLLFPKALEAREFVVYYQPKVTLSNNCLCGCEALVRWFRDGKLVPPMDFIPTLEREGSICRLDFYVLEQVCMDINSWIAKGMEPFCVSINFSKAHLQHDDFADNIIEILKKYKIDSRYIEVELTETSSYENYDNLRTFIRRMRECGVSTSIDDFGTGYSSLNLLKNLDVDIIKLDKSFLDNLEKNKKSDEIVIKHIVGMVSELDMNIIAEGVETSEQADFLRSVHCNMAQGYLFDRPLPREEFEKRLKDGMYNVS